MTETAPRAAISEEEVSALLEKNSGETARPYDFTAQRINRMQLPLLEVICKSFAERAGASLSSLLGRDASLQFTSLESAKSADLQASLPAPASLAIVRLKPLPGVAFISVEPALLLTLLDGFFGGSGRAATDPQAAIAPAAQRFLALMVRSLAADMTVAWAPVTPVELELVKQEINPRLVQLGAPNEALLVAKFTVEFGAHSGRIDWLLGYRYLYLYDQLTIQENLTGLAGSDFPGVNFQITDSFRTKNYFNGVNGGLNYERRFGRLFVGTRATVALGVTHSVVTIDGSTRIRDVDGTVTNFPGGLLALPSTSDETET